MAVSTTRSGRSQQFARWKDNLMPLHRPLNQSLFAHPPADCRGVVLWMLNDELELPELLRQLEEIKSAGWGAVITRTFFGLRTRYLSDEWMAMLDAIVGKAEALGLAVWFQAGYMPGGIPDLDRRMALMAVDRRPAGEPIPEGRRVLREEDGYRYVEYPIDHVLDLLNPAAVEEYLDKAYRQPWQGRFGRHFGRTIQAIWVDEPHFQPPLLPWGDRLQRKFAQRWGYPLMDHLPELFAPVGDYQKVRHHFWRTVQEVFLAGYFEPVSRWCRKHHVRFSGHLMGEDTLNNQIAWTAACMPCYEYMDTPGIDHLTMSLRWPTGHKKFILTPKQCTSAAAQADRPQVLAEIYGVSSSHLTFERRRQIAQWMMGLGINQICYHGAFYSMRGRRKRLFVPHMSYQQPWWPDNRLATDHCARLSYALQQGRPLADILLLHPVESVAGLYDATTMSHPHNVRTESDAVRSLDDRFVHLCDALLSIQRDFHFGDEHLLSRHARVSDGRLLVGRSQYRLVILPEMITIRATTLQLLKEFAAAGGSILAAGTLPQRVDGELNAQADDLAAIVRRVDSTPGSLRSALDPVLPPRLSISSTGNPGAADALAHVRQLEGGSRLFFLVNTSGETPIEGQLSLAGRGVVESWDPQTGQVSRPPQWTSGCCTITPLSLAPLGSALLTLDSDQPSIDVAPPEWHTVRTITATGRGRLRRLAPNALTLDVCRYRQGDGPWSQPLPVVYVQRLLNEARYRGPVTVQFTFHADRVPPVVQLVVEDAAQYQIAVNGQPVTYRGLPYYLDRSFHPIEVTEVVRLGRNTVELRTEFQPLTIPRFPLASLFEVQTGTELEAVYLIGDFAVKGQRSPHTPPSGCVRYLPRFSLHPEHQDTEGDLIADGYPFYAGRLLLSETVPLTEPAEGQRVLLELDSFNAALVRVRLNGHAAGVLAWAPYELDVTAFIHEGDNELELELVSTLRNLLGPHHRPSGEPDSTWATAFNYTPPSRASHGEKNADTWSDDYLFVHFGPQRPVRLHYQELHLVPGQRKDRAGAQGHEDPHPA